MQNLRMAIFKLEIFWKTEVTCLFFTIVKTEKKYPEGLGGCGQ